MKILFLRGMLAILAIAPSFTHTIIHRIETLEGMNGHQVILMYDNHGKNSNEQEESLTARLSTLPNAIVYVEDPYTYCGSNEKIKKILHKSWLNTQKNNPFKPRGLNGLSYRLNEAHITTNNIECRFGYYLIKVNHPLLKEENLTAQEVVEDVQTIIEKLRKDTSAAHVPFHTLRSHTNTVLDLLHERDKEFFKLDGLTKKLHDLSVDEFANLNVELFDLLALHNISHAAHAEKTAVIVAGGFHCLNIKHTLQEIAGYKLTHSTGADKDFNQLKHAYYTDAQTSAYKTLYPAWFKKTPKALNVDCIPLAAQELQGHFAAMAEKERKEKSAALLTQQSLHVSHSAVPAPVSKLQTKSVCSIL